ncbi:MAG: signal peptidase II [Candidatus Krumholzibacteria bacterium]|nr:signal peptidase II [Candidatus Krumholzibacteria bacterium]MDP6669937.1 signal peptidase II [Candidatus Krumholzibacteria bacterium]MDP6796654.1 signal peptidase II [Candidatus Krumholzibacteria bacterium]MDP7021292.1 signal peptidase II [Candidatus Krumholzibacteria bacterium]
MKSAKLNSPWPFFFSVVLAVLFLDLASKQLALDGRWAGPVIPGFLDFTLVTNPGAAFGLFSGARFLFVMIKLLAIGVILYLVASKDRRKPGIPVFPLALILGGAAGNLIDRFRGNGEVIDFIDFSIAGHHWYVFNIADSFISIGAALVALHLLFQPGETRAGRLAE